MSMQQGGQSHETGLRKAMDDVARQRGLGAVVAEARLPLKYRSADVNWTWVAAAGLVVGILALGVIGGSSQVLHLIVLAAALAAFGYLVMRAFRMRSGTGARSTASTTLPARGGVQIAQALQGGAIWGLHSARGGQELRIYTWPEVTRLRMIRLQTRQTAGVLSHTSVQHALQVDQEGLPPLVVRRVGTGRSQDLTRVALAIEDAHTAYVIAAALDALRGGATYSFGAAEVAPEGVRTRGELTPWSQLADVASLMPYTYSGTSSSTLVLRRHDGKRIKAIHPEDLVNARAFIEVLEQAATHPR
ncbi:hypothetical protein [Mangrovactinospora gilvigrisea]|nr:hypothetical protein [Mangrovactinospora gilvigrisea]